MMLLDLGLHLFLGVHKNVGSSRLKDGPLDGSFPIFILTRLGLRSAMAKQNWAFAPDDQDVLYYGKYLKFQRKNWKGRRKEKN